MGAELVDLGDRVVRPPHRPEPVGDGLEVRLEDGFQHELQRGLDHLVGHGGNAEFPQLPRSARLGDLALPHRQRPERARLELGPQVIQELLDTDALFDQPDGHAVHAGRVRAPVALDPAVRHIQRRRVVHEVEQVIEPAARIGRRPAVKLGLHPRYPRPRPPGPDPGRCHSAARLAALQPPSLLETAAALPHVPGSPRLGVLRRLRPAPGRSADSGPSPDPRAGRATTGQTGTVPVFTAIRSTKEEPSSAPAASPRLPRSTSPWPPGRHPHARPGVPRSVMKGTGARRSRPLSARFEPVKPLRDVITLVPRVLLSVTLAGPAPSGSTDTSRLCRGCSRPPRRFPDQAAPSFAALLRQGRRWKVSHLHSNRQRLTAHVDRA